MAMIRDSNCHPLSVVIEGTVWWPKHPCKSDTFAVSWHWEAWLLTGVGESVKWDSFPNKREQENICGSANLRGLWKLHPKVT